MVVLMGIKRGIVVWIMGFWRGEAREKGGGAVANE